MRADRLINQLELKCFTCKNYIELHKDNGFQPHYIAIGKCDLYEEGKGYVFSNSDEPCCMPTKYEQK